MKKLRLTKSLRSQLPFSFAGIALLTTTLIGAVSLFIIWSYYSNMEEQYLDANVHGTANSITRIADNSGIIDSDSLAEYKDVLQNQANIAAFLVQCRVRILDTQDNVISDSGSPSKSWKITVPQKESGNNQPPLQPGEDGNGQPSFSIEPSEKKDENPPAYSFRANPDMFGYLLMQDAVNEYGNRSSIIAKAPFYDAGKNVLGYVELSEGPAYGHQIIDNVIRGWAIASLIGVIVSTLFGFLVSRSLTRPLVDLERVASEMKEGNYEIRSPIFKPDELASLSETFNQMAAHIEQNIETLRDFVSDAAHEIRTPLTSLRADLNLALTEKTQKKSMPMIQRSLEQIERLDHLSHDLLDLSKLESRDEKKHRKKTNLNTLLLELSEVHASAAEQAEIEFEINLPKNPVFVFGDAEQLQRAVSNLLGNAVKFTPAGGKVLLSLRAESQSAFVLMEDTGIGIAANEQEKLFSRFHRGQNTQKFPGSGLGLAIAKAIVEKHNGDIGLVPDKKKTVFFIRLPLYTQKSAI